MEKSNRYHTMAYEVGHQIREQMIAVAGRELTTAEERELRRLVGQHADAAYMRGVWEAQEAVAAKVGFLDHAQSAKLEAHEAAMSDRRK